jgi:hypothetical protein
MPTIYISPLGRLGNNIVQYMAGRLLARAFGHSLVRFKSDCQASVCITDTSNGPYGFSWEWFCEFVAEHGVDGTLRTHPLAKRNLHLSGYFQQSTVYIMNRYWLRSLFTVENTEWLNLSTRVCDLVGARGRNEEGVHVHLRLGDFQVSEERSFILAPRVFLQVLRRAEGQPIHIVAAPPQSPEEKMYFALFNDVGGVYSGGTELEDHATLRSAKTLLCSNSTFAWTAAFLGCAEKLWMPQIRGYSAEQNLAPLPGASELPEDFVFLREFQVDTYPTPFSGEDLEALCDCIVLNKGKEGYHEGLESLVPKKNWVFLETLAAGRQLLDSAQVVFIYEDLFEEALPQILESLTSVRILVLHNADTEPREDLMRQFLERWPGAHIYAQNNVAKHPRIHSLPMGVQNRMWREVSLEASPQCSEKEYLALASHFAATHPLRAELMRALAEKPFEGLYIAPRCGQQQYLANLFASAFSFCPPGNAHDTHRLWESLFCGSIPIVCNEPFIERLLETMPGLPLVVVEGFDSVADYGTFLEQVLRGKNYRFEMVPCLYLKYWSLLFETYR